MDTSARDSYLTTEVMTAPPQKLQLLLIDAAIRSVERARHHWGRREDEQACEALIRAQEVMTELIAGLNRELAPDLVKKVAAIYVFVFRTLVEAGFQHDPQKLDDALKVLHVERQTWRTLCGTMGSTGEAGPQAAAPPAPEARGRWAPLPPSASSSADDLPAAGFSLEA